MLCSMVAVTFTASQSRGNAPTPASVRTTLLKLLPCGDCNDHVSGAELSPGNIRLGSFHAMARVSNSNRLLEIFDCTGISCVSSIEKQYMEGHVSPLLSQSARLQRKFPQKLAQKENEA